MSDLDVLFPHAELRIRGEVFVLRPLPLKLLPVFFRVSKAWEDAIASGGHALDLHREMEAYDLLGWTLGKTGAWVRQLPEGIQLDILAAAMAINHDLFDGQDHEADTLPKMTGPNIVRAKAKRPDMDWGEVIARLVAGGHSWSDLQNYTLKQIQLFAAGLAKIDRDNHISNVVSSTFAMADPKSTKKYISDLTRE